jgi:hypothetical protein
LRGVIARAAARALEAARGRCAQVQRVPRREAAGLAAALWLTRPIKGLLFGIAPGDLSTSAAVSLLLVIVALGACVVSVPAGDARRAVVALRYE